MNLHFNINYNTRYGEELALNIIAFNDDGSDKKRVNLAKARAS